MLMFPFGLVEVVILSLTLKKLWSYGERNRTVTVLARDSIIYFVVVFLSIILKEAMVETKVTCIYCMDFKMYANHCIFIATLLTPVSILADHYNASQA
ncbi:hypothetical protein HWV62_4495 [Athelia sp. TMB]|nr:hypothetical protein HWV62_4495 [Athelia sp. TMB]